MSRFDLVPDASAPAAAAAAAAAASSSSSSSVGDSDEDASRLPFPAPLTRASFGAAEDEFDAAQFLSSLRNRHQSLEDLRQELRELDQLLSRELLGLVNDNYGDFLSLGSALRGGDDKVEEVRVGMLAFEREIRALRDKVESRRAEMQLLVTRKKRLQQHAVLGRRLLDLSESIDGLEQRLLIAQTTLNSNSSSSSSSSSDGDSDKESDVAGPEAAAAVAALSVKRLERHVQSYARLVMLADKIEGSHPFVQSQQSRMAGIKATLLLDLKTALEQSQQAGDKQSARRLAVMRLYRVMGEEAA